MFVMLSQERHHTTLSNLMSGTEYPLLVRMTTKGAKSHFGIDRGYEQAHLHQLLPVANLESSSYFIPRNNIFLQQLTLELSIPYQFLTLNQRKLAQSFEHKIYEYTVYIMLLNSWFRSESRNCNSNSEIFSQFFLEKHNEDSVKNFQ